MKKNNSNSFMFKIFSLLRNILLMPFFLIYVIVLGSISLVRYARIKGIIILTAFPYASFYLCNNSEIFWGVIVMLFVVAMVLFSYSMTWGSDDSNYTKFDKACDNFFYKDEMISPNSSSKDNNKSVRVERRPLKTKKAQTKAKAKKETRVHNGKEYDMEWILAEKAKIKEEERLNNIKYKNKKFEFKS